MILSHKKRFIFFACGKTGTTSIESILQEYNDGEGSLAKLKEDFFRLRDETGKSYQPRHARPEIVKNYLSESVWNEYFKFVFVRNPWDWVVSQYYYDKREQRKLFFPPTKFKNKHVRIVWERKKRQNLIDYTESYLQSPFAFDFMANKIVNFIGHFENLEKDFNKVCRHLEIPESRLPVLNSTKHKAYKELYTPKAINLVRSLYQRDIELLGYDYDKTPEGEAIYIS